MTWPAVQVKTNFDAAGDDPKLARSEFAGNVDKFNQLQAHVSSYMQGVLDDADAAAARVTLSAQTLDATLTSLAAVAGVAGDVLYASGTDAWARLAKGTDGEVLTLASGIPSWAGPAITRFSSVATTSGASHEFTGIQAGADRLTFMLSGVSLSGTETFLIQLGDAAGYEQSGYVSIAGDEGASTVGATSGYSINRNSLAAQVWSGTVVFTRHSGDKWIMAGSMGNGLSQNDCSGQKTLSDELTRIRIVDTGSNSFDGGSIALLVE